MNPNDLLARSLRMAKQKKRNIVVTGVSKGLGLALLRRFSADDHLVFGCARSKTSIAKLAKEFAGPERFEAVDVKNDKAVQSWANSIISQFGPPDIVINNAAIINDNTPFWEISCSDFDRVIDINIKGVANTIRAFLPSMLSIPSGSGLIVNFSSYWGRSVSSDVAPYCTSKWAIEGLTKALAEDLPKSLATVALNSGIIATEMLESCFGSAASQYPSPEQWAEDAASFILSLGHKHNGASLTVPGH